MCSFLNLCSYLSIYNDDRISIYICYIFCNGMIELSSRFGILGTFVDALVFYIMIILKLISSVRRGWSQQGRS